MAVFLLICYIIMCEVYFCQLLVLCYCSSLLLCVLFCSLRAPSPLPFALKARPGAYTAAPMRVWGSAGLLCGVCMFVCLIRGFGPCAWLVLRVGWLLSWLAASLFLFFSDNGSESSLIYCKVVSASACRKHVFVYR